MSTTKRNTDKAINQTAQAAKEATNEASHAAHQANDKISESMNDGIERMTQGLSQFSNLGQENVEAMVESATKMAKGFEQIATENADYAKKQMEVNGDRFQAITKAKTPQEFFEAQADIVRSSMETHINQMNKVSDMFVATARDAAQPLSKRYTAVVDTFQQR